MSEWMPRFMWVIGEKGMFVEEVSGACEGVIGIDFAFSSSELKIDCVQMIVQAVAFSATGLREG